MSFSALNNPYRGIDNWRPSKSCLPKVNIFTRPNETNLESYFHFIV